ncbi:DUF5916 domain-containing protein [Cognatiluteimonas weifangensis]|uniref:DUF5916 domain-containing protein n=1 Tax=Cognatiluteimonas weifangensis TaxID=2303539 RepID=A0A372DS48_9GAMM|nr:DUF5916 domain-containing protein [Luteimonas weifangensis]RFP62401.1 hypothetical protein D0Y53_00850 [Luteimonas weifangensis]
MRALLATLLLATAGPALAIDVDGRIDPAEWQGAEHITDFRVVEPLTRAPSPYPTEAWIKATPEGLAIGFRNTQPASVPRTYRRTQRDEDAQVDRVNLMVDFDGDGRTGYNFTLYITDGIIDATIANESDFNKDWDGNWRHATSEDGDTWSAEMLIPWYIAPMRKGAEGKRTLGIYLDRVIGSTGERVAWPAASFTRPRFLSEFSPLAVPQYSQSLLAVTPYAVGSYDNIAGQEHFDAGVDLVWKPNGQTQLTATVNPDFGQVESDDLVVNFGANETFFSDKRPFFTENQGIFDFGTPSDFSQLLYTRRVGGPADDGSGPGDITAAVKLNGSLGAYKYGLFAAEEADAAGRSFRALRLVRDYDKQNLGLMLTQVEHPYLDREATVLGIDHNWRPTEHLNVQTRLLGSRIDQAGDSTRGSGATVVVDYELDNGWRSQWLAMHFGDSLQINDFGYLSRANLNYGHWQLSRRFTDLPETSAYASHEWRWRISGTDNDHGLALQRQFRMMRQSTRRDGGNEYAQININSAGQDDRLLRGHGSIAMPANFNAFYERSRPRKGDWEFYGNVGINRGGIGPDRKLGYNAQFRPTYFISDAFNVFVLGYLEHAPQWVVWQRDNLVGTFDERALEIDAGVNWTIGDRQELRVKLQAIGLEAKLRQAWRAAPDGTPIPVQEPVADFSLRNLGFQVRYRYELAPLSDLYVVYGRGGYLLDEFARDEASQLRDAFALRDSEQLLIKLSYRFEL